MSATVGILGSGIVGQTLANGFIKYGYDVMIGTGDASKHVELKEKTAGKAKIGTFAETAQFGQLLVLATKGSAAESALQRAGIQNIGSKVVMDATNPIADLPPINGALQFFTNTNDSLMERLQRLAPSAKFVKVFNCVGSAFMINPDFGGQKPTMFLCGNDDSAKSEVKRILEQFGWEYEDMGMVESARAIEPLCILWCLPGFRLNQWSHAFKLLKK